MARPRKFTPERADALVENIRKGASRRAAAAMSGIHVDTLQTWIAAGRSWDGMEGIEPDEHERELIEFSERIAFADGELEIELMDHAVTKALASDDPMKALAVLKLKWPQAYDPTARLAEQLERNEWALREKERSTLTAVIMGVVESLPEAMQDEARRVAVDKIQQIAVIDALPADTDQ